MEDMDALKYDIGDLKQWRGVTNHRLDTVEAHYKQEVTHRIRLEAEVNQVDSKVSRIEGGIDTLKWLIPIGITVASFMSTAIVWFLTQ